MRTPTHSSSKSMAISCPRTLTISSYILPERTSVSDIRSDVLTGTLECWVIAHAGISSRGIIVFEDTDNATSIARRTGTSFQLGIPFLSSSTVLFRHVRIGLASKPLCHPYRGVFKLTDPCRQNRWLWSHKESPVATLPHWPQAQDVAVTVSTIVFNHERNLRRLPNSRLPVWPYRRLI